MEQLVMTGGWRDVKSRHRADNPQEPPGPKRLGRWLQREMSYRGMTQEDLADQLNINRTNVSRWWKGEKLPSQNTLERFSTVFGVDMDFLLEITGYRPPQVELGDDVEALISMLRSLRFDYDPDRHGILRGIIEAYRNADRRRAIEERN